MPQRPTGRRGSRYRDIMRLFQRGVLTDPSGERVTDPEEAMMMAEEAERPLGLGFKGRPERPGPPPGVPRGPLS